jgi:uncharacterized protein YdcH (DUF465 family)
MTAAQTNVEASVSPSAVSIGATYFSRRRGSLPEPFCEIARRQAVRALAPCTSRGGRLMFENQQKEVEVLIKSDSEFRSLYQRHQELDSKVRDAELGVLPLDDTTLHNMKKEKLRAKDRLTNMWERYRSTH